MEGTTGRKKRTCIAIVAMSLIAGACSSGEHSDAVSVVGVEATIGAGSEPTTVQTDFVATATETVAGPVDIGVIEQPDRPVAVTFDIPDSYAGPLDELVIATFDQSLGRWTVLPTTIDAQNATATASTDHFSLFKLVQIIEGALEFLTDLFTSIVLGVPDAEVSCPNAVETLFVSVERRAAPALDVCVEPDGEARDDVWLTNVRSYPLLVRSPALVSGSVESRSTVPDATALAVGAMASVYEDGTQFIVLPGQEIVLDLPHRSGGSYSLEVWVDPGPFAMKVIIELVLHLVGGIPDGEAALDFVALAECMAADVDLGEVLDACGRFALDAVLGSAAGPLNSVLSVFATGFSGVQFLSDSALQGDGGLETHHVIDTTTPDPDPPPVPTEPPTEWAPPTVDIDPDVLAPPETFPVAPDPPPQPDLPPPIPRFTMRQGDASADENQILILPSAVGDVQIDGSASQDASGDIEYLWFIDGTAVSDRAAFPFPLEVLGPGNHQVLMVVSRAESIGSSAAVGARILIEAAGSEPDVADNGPILVTDQVAGEVYTIDPKTGTRTVVAAGPGPAAAVWTNDKTSFVYTTLDLTSDPLQVSYVEVDADSGATETVLTSKYDFVGVLSPDASRTAGIPFIDFTTIWVVELGPGESSTVVPASEGLGSVAWFPGGQALAFSTCTTTDPTCRIHVADLSVPGEASTRVVGETPFDLVWGVAVSPDRTKVALSSGRWPEGPYDLYLLDLRAGSLSQVTDTPDTDEFRPVFSPDGAFIAFSSRPAGDPFGPAEILLEIIGVDGSGRRTITSLTTQADGYDWD